MKSMASSIKPLIPSIVSMNDLYGHDGYHIYTHHSGQVKENKFSYTEQATKWLFSGRAVLGI